MSIFDYWRLIDEFSLAEATLLILGVNPEDLKRLDSYNRFVEDCEYQQEVNGYKIPDAEQAYKPEFDTDPYEWEERYNVLVKVLSRAVLSGRLNAEKKVAKSTVRDVFDDSSRRVDGEELDVNTTMISRVDIQEWLKSKGIQAGFFFPHAELTGTPAYLNPEHEHYAPKLAAAVNAWLAVSGDPELLRKRNPKQAIDVWLRSNADRYGLTKDDGSPNEQGITEISKVANWKMAGVSKTGA